MDLVTRTLHRIWTSQAGEGVISTAIAVLIMAVIGAGMFLAFSGTFQTAQTQIDSEISQIQR